MGYLQKFSLANLKMEGGMGRMLYSSQGFIAAYIGGHAHQEAEGASIANAFLAKPKGAIIAGLHKAISLLGSIRMSY